MVERSGLPWLDLGTTPSQPFSGVDVVSARYVVSHTTDPRTVVVRRCADNAVVLRHTTVGPEWEVAFADLAGDKLVVADVDTGGDPNGTQVVIYDLVTGRVTRLVDIASAPPASAFGHRATVTDDGRYFYSANVKRTNNQSFNCVAMVDLSTMRGSTVECAGDGEGESVGYYLTAGEDGATWLHVQGPTLTTCRTGRGIRGTQLITVGPADACTTIATTTVGGESVWSAAPIVEALPGPDVPLQATDRGATVGLGYLEGAALTMCGSYAYWRTTDRPSHTIQLRRWRPGLSQVEIAYKILAPDDSPIAYQLGLGGCADDLFTLQVETHDPSIGGRTQVLTLQS
ncbi:MAG: hypothetical protein ACM30G_06435 [Micromonosporaceae bacterium]